MADREDRNTGIIEEFRANHGKVGGYFEGRPLLLLTMRGAKSGAERTTPLAYLADGERFVIFATKGGTWVAMEDPQNPSGPSSIDVRQNGGHRSPSTPRRPRGPSP